MVVRCQYTVVSSRRSAPGATVVIVVVLLVMTTNCFVASTGRVRLTSDSIGVDATANNPDLQQERQRTAVLNRQTSADINGDDGKSTVIDEASYSTDQIERFPLKLFSVLYTQVVRYTCSFLLVFRTRGHALHTPIADEKLFLPDCSD